MTEAEETPTTRSRIAATALNWSAQVRAIHEAITAADAFAETIPAPNNAPADVIKALEAQFGEMVIAHDRLVDRAMATPAPDVAAVRWKLQFLAERFAEDNAWDELERLIPTVVADVLRFLPGDETAEATQTPAPVRPRTETHS